MALLHHALKSPKGFGNLELSIEEAHLRAIARFANGDARTALNTLEMALVSFKYGGNIFPVATSKRPIRLVVPWRIYSNSIFASCPGSGSLSGYLCSNAWTPVISSVETTQVSSFIRSVLLRYKEQISFTFAAKVSGLSLFSGEWSQ